MTGGTLIVKCGNFFAMTKVAHDGYDLDENKSTLQALANNAEQPQDVLVAYLRSRGGIDFDYASLDVMTDDVEQCYIVREYNDSPSFDEVLNRMDTELNKDEAMESIDDEHPWMQLGCCYSDYTMYIDLNAGNSVGWLNGDKVW